MYMRRCQHSGMIIARAAASTSSTHSPISLSFGALDVSLRDAAFTGDIVACAHPQEKLKESERERERGSIEHHWQQSLRRVGRSENRRQRGTVEWRQRRCIFQRSVCCTYVTASSSIGTTFVHYVMCLSCVEEGKK